MTSGDRDGSSPVGFRLSVGKIVALTPSLCTYNSKSLGNPVESSLRDTAKATLAISLRYQFVCFSPKRVLTIASLEVPSRTPAQLGFDYDEVSVHFCSPLAFVLMLQQPSTPTSSDHLHEDEIPTAAPSHPMPQPLDFPPETPQLEACAQEHLDTVDSPRARSIFSKLLQRKNHRGPTLHKPGQLFAKSCEYAKPQSPSDPPARIEDRHEGPSRMAAARPTPVSALPYSMIGCSVITYCSSEWPRGRAEDERFVVSRDGIQGLIARHRIKNRLPRVLLPNLRTKILLVADKGLRVRTKPVECVFFLAMVELAVTAHVLSGTTNE